jgi:beta-lactamase superfamily II metal-dependent hydrolase
MKIEVHDVGHGACAVVTCPNGARIMLDCGFHRDRKWFPSVVFAGQFIDALALTNLDEDHVDDLPYLWKNVRIGSIYSNPSVSASALATMKAKDGMDSGVRYAHALLTQFGPGHVGTMADSGDAFAWAYSNVYGVDFDGRSACATNNLSLATFVRWGSFTMLFAGDLEVAGWRALLRYPEFVRDLATVKVLVASHHGRRNGCCDDVFKVVRPEIVIFSDDAKRFETQETDSWYRHRVMGIPVRGTYPLKKRHVYTTRRDGTITIDVHASGQYLVTPSRADDEYEFLLELFGRRAA